jgi:anti-repressor protein
MDTKALQIFNFNSTTKVTVITDENGNPWWVAKEVCRILGLTNPSMAVRKLDEDEKGISIVDTPGGPQKVWIVTEAGLYELIFLSRKPEAKEFKRWVKHEVLPRIRKSGGYIVGADKMSREQILDAAVQIHKDMLAEAEKKIEELKPKAEVHDQLLYSDTGSISMRAAAKILGMSGQNLGILLYNHGVLFKQNNWGAGRSAILVPKQEYIAKGYFEVRYQRIPGGNFKPQTLVTPKGMTRIPSLLELKAAA